MRYGVPMAYVSWNEGGIEEILRRYVNDSFMNNGTNRKPVIGSGRYL